MSLLGVVCGSVGFGIGPWNLCSGNEFQLKMGICLEQWRVSIGLFHCCLSGGYQTVILLYHFSLLFVLFCLNKVFQYFKYACKWLQCLLESSFFNFQFMLVMCILLLEAGDIERNPGPGTDNAVSILHLNVRSIRNKIKYIQDNFTDLDILCFSEIHLDLNVSSDLLCISNSYSIPYRKDRNCHGGRLLMYINFTLFHCRRSDLELFCQESIWTEIKVKHDTYLTGLFYSPVTSDATCPGSYQKSCISWGF